MKLSLLSLHLCFVSLCLAQDELVLVQVIHRHGAKVSDVKLLLERAATSKKTLKADRAPTQAQGKLEGDLVRELSSRRPEMRTSGASSWNSANGDPEVCWNNLYCSARLYC